MKTILDVEHIIHHLQHKSPETRCIQMPVSMSTLNFAKW